MEEIIKFVANDGKEFTDKTKCEDHESNLDIASSIMSKLAENPKGCDFSNGSGYIQHEIETLTGVRAEFLEFCKRYTNHKWIQQSIDEGLGVDPSWAGRIINECAPGSIYQHWHRFSCMDSKGREWGQSYYALNPDQAENVRLNP